MPNSLPAKLGLVMLGVASGSVASAAEPPAVVASILPIHSLVAGVMAGVAEPALLVAPGGSPHGYQMRPSEARALQNADLAFWVGESLETFLVRPLDALDGDATVVELVEAPGVELLPPREGGVWRHEDHAELEGHHHDGNAAEPELGEAPGHLHGEYDPHVWLSPANARAIVAAAASALGQADPERAEIYGRNAADLQARLATLETELRAELAPVRNKPFVVLHDAYQYLEHAFDLTAAGSITVSPDRQPSAARLRELKDVIAGRQASCVFSEPQLGPQLAEAVVDGTTARVGMLNPEGSPGAAAGPAAYFDLLRENASALIDCLARAS